MRWRAATSEGGGWRLEVTARHLWYDGIWMAEYWTEPHDSGSSSCVQASWRPKRTLNVCPLSLCASSLTGR